ncbi:MAG: hypothetical protein ACI974_000514, partial [Paraglaciecola sp.]
SKGAEQEAWFIYFTSLSTRLTKPLLTLWELPLSNLSAISLGLR